MLTLPKSLTINAPAMSHGVESTAVGDIGGCVNNPSATGLAPEVRKDDCLFETRLSVFPHAGTSIMFSREL